MDILVQRFEEIGSTNDEAARQARLGAAEGTCIVARMQTAGRGRHGRTWVSDRDSGLYFSIVLRPRLGADKLSLITLASGVAVFDLLKDLGLKPDIKWVNDVLVGDKKICGALAETVETPQGLAVILGIGINLTSRNFPPEIADTATSIEAELGKGRQRPDGIEVEGILVKYLGFWYDVLCGAGGDQAVIEAWTSRSSFSQGKSVRVSMPGEVVAGVTDGIEINGALRVKCADGSLRKIQAGDVERVRAEGYN